MLYHHDARNYEAAASDAASRARANMEKVIADGQASAVRTMEHIFTNVPEDALVRNRGLEIAVEGGQVLLGAKGLTAKPVSKHALGQLASKLGVPGKYVTELLHSGNPALEGLVRENLTTLARQADDERYLVRAAAGQVRGILSDSYKRIDARPLAEAFAGASEKAGLVPIQGFATETKVSLKAMLPVIFEPAAHEVVTFGLHWETSDFGAGAHNVMVFMLRLWCTNFASTERALRQVHIGKRLDDISFSAKTHLLETRAMSSALSDIVASALSPDRVKSYCDVITRADADKVDANKALEKLVKDGSLLKGESKAIADKFSSADVEMLPAGNTTWRLSNAISWFAHAGGAEADRRMELERIAGNVLPTAPKAA